MIPTKGLLVDWDASKLGDKMPAGSPVGGLLEAPAMSLSNGMVEVPAYPASIQAPLLDDYNITGGWTLEVVAQNPNPAVLTNLAGKGPSFNMAPAGAKYALDQYTTGTVYVDGQDDTTRYSINVNNAARKGLKNHYVGRFIPGVSVSLLYNGVLSSSLVSATLTAAAPTMPFKIGCRDRNNRVLVKRCRLWSEPLTDDEMQILWRQSGVSV